jgi:hypothetical protein
VLDEASIVVGKGWTTKVAVVVLDALDKDGITGMAATAACRRSIEGDPICSAAGRIPSREMCLLALPVSKGQYPVIQYEGVH